VRFEEVARVLDGLDAARVRYRVAGGWGVAALAGTDFIYPPAAFSAAVLRGRRIACLSRDQQRVFHQGYTLQPKDRHDLQQLGQLDRLT